MRVMKFMPAMVTVSKPDAAYARSGATVSRPMAALPDGNAAKSNASSDGNTGWAVVRRDAAAGLVCTEIVFASVHQLLILTC